MTYHWKKIDTSGSFSKIPAFLKRYLKSKKTLFLTFIFLKVFQNKK
jgi:hypothetical protein